MEKEIQASVEVDIPFSDVDSLEVVWHGHYFRYFEAARTALLRSIGYDVLEMRESGFAWPIVECKCRYLKPIAYGNQVTVEARLLEHEAFLKIAYEIFDSETKEKLCRGYTVQAAVDMQSGRVCSELPERFLSALRGG